MIPDLTTLAGLTPEVLAKSIGTTKADAVIAYLRRHPDVVIQQAPGSLAIARDKLAQSLAAYRGGDRHAAQELALSAYLDGFEPLEPMLTARDATLMRSEEHTSELQSLMRISYAVFCLAKKTVQYYTNILLTSLTRTAHL